MKVGTDPETFLWSVARRCAVPAHKFFPPKDEAIDVGKGMKVFRDGYAVEINVPPQDNPEDLIRLVNEAKAIINKMMVGHGLVTWDVPAVKIRLHQDMDGAPEDVKYFGCEPSYCAYTGRRKMPRISAMSHPWRYAGDHMHFSASPKEQKDWAEWLFEPAAARRFIRLMDRLVGLEMTVRDSSNLQFIRRQHYGQAGEFRPQEYPDGSVGLEYRVPASGSLAWWMFDRGMALFRRMHQLKFPMGGASEVRAAIDRGKRLLQVERKEAIIV